MAVIAPEDEATFYAICAKWDVEAATIGEVTGNGRLVIDFHGETIVDVDPRTVAHDGPVYERPLARPAWQDALQADVAEALPRPSSPEEIRATWLRLVASPNLCDKSWVTSQYDHYVRGNTVLAKGSDSGMIRIAEDSVRGVALATDGNGRFAKLDPYVGAQLALAESYRNVATVGATPLAISDCLNFGSPEDPDVMWQFAQACRGLKDACLTLGVPVTGGNVSLYNQTGDVAILPTPVVATLGTIDDVTRRTPSAFVAESQRIFVLGETREELSGSEWAHVVHGHLGGLPPVVDLAAEQRNLALLQAARDLVTSAHDLSDGGLAQTLAEASFGAGIGAQLALSSPAFADPFLALFSESAGRILVTTHLEDGAAFVRAASAAGVVVTEIGVTGGDVLAIEGLFEIPVAELRDAWQATLPAALAGDPAVAPTNH